MRILLALVVLAFTGPAFAAPKQVAYIGVHPLPEHEFCEIEGPHVHVQAPEQANVLYVVVEGRYRFIGDPTPYGYEGPKFAYHGHHVIVGETYCRLDGAHFHVEAPAVKASFALRGGVYWYLGVVAPVVPVVPVVYVHHHHHHKHKKHHHKHH